VLLHDGGLLAMDGTDGQSAMAGEHARPGQGLVARSVARLEGLVDLFDDLFEFLHKDYFLPLSGGFSGGGWKGRKR